MFWCADSVSITYTVYVLMNVARYCSAQGSARIKNIANVHNIITLPKKRR